MTRAEEVGLDPAVFAWAKRIDEIARDLPALSGPIGADRRRAALALSDALAREFTLPTPNDVAVDDVEIAGPAGTVRMRRFRPHAIEGPAPTQLFLHGGGFYAGTIDEILNDRICARRARDAGIQIYSLEYRLAPENPYPAAADDAVAAWQELLRSAGTLGVDTSRVGVGGNSAGATIAASAAIMLRDARGPVPFHQDLEVIAAGLAPTGESAVEFAQGFGLDDAGELVEVYLGREPGDVSRASPLDVSDLSGLPSALIMVAEFDPLRDSGIAYAERLREAGVDATLIIGRGHLHGTPGLTQTFAAAREWQSVHAQELAIAYGTTPTGH